MNIAIVGFATEGQSIYKYFLSQGHNPADITICDQNPDLSVPEGANGQLGENYLTNLDRFDKIIRSAGIPPSLLLEQNPSVDAKISSVINEFMDVCPTTNIIGVTGTKGKGTTSSLIKKMLQEAGKTAWLGGNIGISPLDFLDNIRPDDWVVLELSSFQLIDLKKSPHIGVCLMVVPEHLNWHEDYEEYIAAKQQLFINQSENDIAIYYAKNEDSLSVAGASQGKLVPYFEEPGAVVEQNEIKIDGISICNVNEMGLLGAHNWQNACAATTAVWQAGIRDVRSIRNVLTTFTGLEHRLELVREFNDVRYYDDSFGTTPETAIVALEAFEEPKVIVLGGSSKNADFSKLAQAVKDNNVRHVILIGDEADRLQESLEKVGLSDYSLGLSKMTDIVKLLAEKSKAGDVALLSTGCASFGLFKDYKDRGSQFKQAVKALREDDAQ